MCSVKLLRPAYAGQIGIFGVGQGELEQSTHGEEESKYNLNGCDYGIHYSLYLS